MDVSGKLLTLLGLSVLLIVSCGARKRLDDIETQILELQRQVLQLQRQSPNKEDLGALEREIRDKMDSVIRSGADIQVQLRDLSTEIEQLRASLEDASVRLAQLSQQIASTNQELNALRSGVPLAEGTGNQGGTEDPQALYQAAYNDYLRGNFELAISQFRQYLSSFPNTDLSDNATYWLGECFYRMSEFQNAIEAFDKVLNDFPRSDKIASSLLKKGYAYLELGQRNQGVTQLRHVVRQYPGSDEANLASQRLTEVGVDAN